MGIWKCPKCEHELYGSDLLKDIKYFPPNGMRIEGSGKCPSCQRWIFSEWHIMEITGTADTDITPIMDDD